MAYNEKIYVAYDGKNDSVFFKQMIKWQQSNNQPFEFFDAFDLSLEIEKIKEIDRFKEENLKKMLQDRMSEAKVCLLIVSKTTKSYRKFIRWQIEYAINKDMPIIALNVNGIRSVDYDRCPTVLKKNLSLHITFQPEIVEYALDRWPESHQKHREKKHLHTIRYSEKVYEKLGLETMNK